MRAELQEAIALLRQADEQSVQKAVQLLQSTVFSFSMKVCGHREDAEDTMQEVLLSSLPHLKKIEDARALSVWLYTAARNRCWRSRKRQSYRKSVALDDLMPGDAELAALLASSAQSPEMLAASHQDQQMVHHAVLRLPPSYRMVLVLHDMEELDTEQVARVLGIRPGTVRVRLHRARLLVRQEMDKLLRGDPEQTSPAAARPAPTARARPLQCREIFGNLSEYLDGRMETKSCTQMQAHIETCPACIAFIQDLKAAIDRCRSFEIPMDSETGITLRRVLAEEYLRLLGSGEAAEAPAPTSFKKNRKHL
jgi:RNA polymerase sigma-70 factor (ECF subfamily)